MSRRFETELSKSESGTITIRNRDLVTDVMGEMDFCSSIHLLITGTEPSEGERRILNATLSALMVHGLTSHAIAARLTYYAAPESMQAAVASGILGVGSRFVGSMEDCSRILQQGADADNPAAFADEIVLDHIKNEKSFPGLGHRHFDETDPRAELLFSIAEAEGISGRNVELLHDIRSRFNETLDAHLVINVTGAIGAITADMGYSPLAARGLGIVSRSAGIVAEVIDEETAPMAQDMYEYIEEA